MKKLALLLALLLTLGCFAGCGDSATDTGSNNATNSAASAASDALSDLAYVQANGKLVVGMTIYEPMNYKDANGEWTGFDTEFAQAVAEKLGVEVEFVEIDWDNKWATLNSKKIDVVWNGMTLTDEAETNATCTNPYVLNAQVVVMKADQVAQYADAESMKGLTFAVEAGSAGKGIAEDNGYTFTEYAAQTDAMTAVKTGKADACIIDITMAKAMTGAGSNYTDLGIGISLTEEEYAIACRKGSDLAAKINELMNEMLADGSLESLADKYNLNLAD